MGGLFFPLAALAKQLRSTTMRLFGRLASDKNRLAESDHLLFAHSYCAKLTQIIGFTKFLSRICQCKITEREEKVAEQEKGYMILSL